MKGVPTDQARMLTLIPILLRPSEASEPYSRGQWDSALKATPHRPKGDVSYVAALTQTVRSGAHGFWSRRPRSQLTVLNIVRLGVSDEWVMSATEDPISA